MLTRQTERARQSGHWITGAGLVGVFFMVAGVAGNAQEVTEDAASPPADAAAEAEDPRPQRGAESDDIFIPSEEVQADEELVFPVDI